MDATDRSEVDIDLCAALAARAKVLELHHLSTCNGGVPSIMLKIDLPTGDRFERHYRLREPLLGSTPAYRGEETNQAFPTGGVNEIHPTSYGRIWRQMNRLNQNRDPGSLERMITSGTVTRTEEHLSLEDMRAFHYEPATD